ncbi:antigen WC1.1 [Xyrauchen texanus]|uniref:antigen WC1.1 n=1 Tax=Xyrauchen texanus TaxID=154827 RepID=UPI0022419F61|nr:antigen WC1.1 [Xyrauchen texanus]
MDQVNCKSTEDSLWNCSHVGPNIEDCKNNLVAVECSGNVTMSLNMNGQLDKCAGAVQFSTEKGIFGICNSEWDKNKAKKICQELNCGEHYYIPEPGIFNVQMITQYVSLKCVDNEQYSWQCAEWSTNCKDQASVICTKHRRFRLRDGSNVCSGLVEEHNSLNKLWIPLQKKDNPGPEVICAHLNCGTTGNFTNNLQLTCSGNVKLRNFTSKCFGAVYININGSDHGVCFNDLHKTKMGMVVCRELDCGEVLDVKQDTAILNGLLSNVDCQGDELSLWHCQAKHERRECKSTNVVCAGSLEIRLIDGLGRCSGRVEMKLGDTWKSISAKDWTPENSDVVCNHFGCGTSTKMNKELFVKGNQPVDKEWKVKCNSSSAKPSDCFYKTNSRHEKEYENVQIICQKEELMFFEGDFPCQGRVRIESFAGESRWLPVNSTNKTDVCHAMQCGTVVDVSFETEKNTTHANVKCLVKAVKVSLRNSGVDGCWGMVEVCRDKKCGGVCSKTWKTEDSKKVCENLGCGDQIKGTPPNTLIDLQVNDYSVYCSKGVKNISMCNFIPNTDFICRSPANVICTASVKAKLEDPRDKCAGKVHLFYPGKWTPVCNDSLDRNVQNAICSELNCGVAESVVGPLYGESQAQGLSGLKCANGVNSVSKCNLSDISVTTECNIGYLKCSEWKRLILYKKEGTCSGPVYGVSSGNTPPQLISDQVWGKEEGQIMCKYLQCGDYISHSSKPSTTNEWWNKTYNCRGKKNIWDCESDNVHVQTHQLNIKCDGKSNLALSNNCTGEVLINKDRVCEWDDQMSHKVCDSLGCGKAIHHWGTQVSLNTDGWYFSCTDREMLLWQCASKKGKCDKTVSLACQKSIEFSSTEKCGGKLLVRYRDKWEFVCGDLKATDVKKVCEALNCKNSKTLPNEKEIAKEIKVALKCPDTYQSVSQCVQHLKENKCKHEPAIFKCEGYVPKEKSQVNYGLKVGLSLGILVLLVLIIIWRQKKRLHLLLTRYRNKDDKDITRDGNEMNHMGTEDEDLYERKMPFDKDDYEDVNFAQGEDDVDDRSKGSSGTEYDDIERQVNDVSPLQTLTDFDPSLPLLPKRPENMIADDVTYEVEIENQEDYDDVMPADANENAGIPTKTVQAQVDALNAAEDAVNMDVMADTVTCADANAVFVTTEVDVTSNKCNEEIM